MITSSPSSIKPINALNIPVLVSSLSGGGQKTLTFVCAGGDGDLGVWVELSTPQWRVRIRNCLLKARASSRWGVLIAVDSIKSILCGLENEIRRVVSKEALAHIHNGLLRGSRSSFIYNGPVHLC
jgi:hypothetical protein